MKLTSTLACCVAVALLGAVAAAAQVPFEASWKRAAKQARFAAVPAPSRLGAFAVLRSGPGGTGGIKGAYRRVRIGVDKCLSFLNQSVSGYFQRSTDGATLTLRYFRKYSRACPHPGESGSACAGSACSEPGWGWRQRPPGSSVTVYEVRGTLQRRSLRLSGVGISADDTVAVARKLRWVRR